MSEVIRDTLTCACGYDLRGLRPDGRCPECGRPVGEAVGSVPAAVAVWRRRVRAGGGLVAVGWLLWAGSVLGWQMPAYHPLIFVLAVRGPRVSTTLEPLALFTLLSTAAKVLATVAVATVAAGLILMARVPRELRNGLRGWTASTLQRAAAAVVVLQACIAALDLWAVDGTRSAELVRVRIWGEFSLLEALTRAAAWADPILWVAAGLFLAATAAAAGRRGLGVRAMGVAFAAAASAAVGWRVNSFVGEPMVHWVVHPAADAALSAGAYTLVVRFGWMSFWSPRRWAAGSGCGPDGDGI